MSTLELPASIALILVMANLALCLSSEDRRLRITSPIASATTATTTGTGCHTGKAACTSRPR